VSLARSHKCFPDQLMLPPPGYDFPSADAWLLAKRGVSRCVCVCESVCVCVCGAYRGANALIE